MIASKSLAIVRGQPARYSLMAFPGSSSSSCRRNMSTLVRFKENERLASSASHEKLEQKLQDGAKSPTDPKITANELEEVCIGLPNDCHHHWIGIASYSRCRAYICTKMYTDTPWDVF
jgi:hypothetical protein